MMAGSDDEFEDVEEDDDDDSNSTAPPHLSPSDTSRSISDTLHPPLLVHYSYDPSF